jgi:hypothetical protein
MDTTNIYGIKVPSIIKTLKPKLGDWIEIQPSGFVVRDSIAATAWLHRDGFFAISAIEKAYDKDGIDKGPEYHLSFSRQNAFGVFRVTSNQAKWLLSEFGCDGAIEDNHVPFGKVRNFWRPVNENFVGIECVCVGDEPAIKEDKGDYIWRPA